MYIPHWGVILISCYVLFKKLTTVKITKPNWLMNFLLHGRSIPQKSPLVHLLINEECNIPWLFLVDLVTTAANEDLLEQVKRRYCKLKILSSALIFTLLHPELMKINSK